MATSIQTASDAELTDIATHCVNAINANLTEYDGSDDGKMAHYMLRWRMRDGTTAAWGETVSATITG
jgi:hypothetical protein